MSIDEDPIPIKDLTQLPSRSHLEKFIPDNSWHSCLTEDNVHQTKQKGKQKTQGGPSLTIVEYLDSKPVPPKRLPNGNYECVLSSLCEWSNRIGQWGAITLVKVGIQVTLDLPISNMTMADCQTRRNADISGMIKLSTLWLDVNWPSYPSP